MQAGSDGGAPHVGLKQRQVAVYEGRPSRPRQPRHAGRIRLIALADILGTAPAAAYTI